MSETDTTDTATTSDESGGDFDAALAKRTIEALRAELKKAKEDKAPQDEKDARAIAGLKKQVEELTQQASEVDNYKAKAQEAEEAAAEVAISLHRERAARVNGLTDDQVEFLAELTDTEAIDARAQKLAAMTAHSDRPVDPSQGSTAGGDASASTADMFAAAVDGAFTR
jgi:hypothetical protein